jgi:hypothetical protein
MEFDHESRLIKQDHIFQTELNEQQHQVISTLWTDAINCFAKEFALVGSYKMRTTIIACAPSVNCPMSQIWHSDNGAKWSQIIELKNDFSEFTPGALQIAINSNLAPTEEGASEDPTPESNSIVELQYPPFGAIYVKADRGNIIHRMKCLPAAPLNEDGTQRKRWILLVILQDDG